MSAPGLADLRADLLQRGTLDRSGFRDVRWEVGGFRDQREQSMLDQLRQDLVEGRLEASPALRAKVLEYVQRGPDGFGRRVWNATKGMVIGVGAVGAVAGAVFLLKPSIVMFVVAKSLFMQGAPIAALGGSAFGALWDN